LIQNRRETILKNLEEADNKFLEAQENLKMALKNLEASEIKANQIRSQSTFLANQTSKSLLDNIDEDIKRLEKLNIATIRFEEQKSINEVFIKLLLKFSLL
jgi:F0F1-type ATP synthase membrane subunit b/b'